MKTASKQAPLSPEPLSAPRFLRTAKALLLRRRTNEAINLLRRGLNLDPSCSEAALLLAKSLVALKQLNEAREQLERLLEREDSAAGWVLLVKVLIADGQLASATETAQRALARHPRDASLRELAAGLRAPEVSALAPLLTAGSASARLEAEDAPTLQTPEPAFEEAEEQVTLDVSGALPDAYRGDPAGGGTGVITPTVRAPAVIVLAQSMRARRAPPPEAMEPEEEISASTAPTPLPSDELGFDRRSAARAPNSAPDLSSTVKQIATPDSVDDPTPRRPLFAPLLHEAEGGQRSSSARSTRPTRPMRPLRSKEPDPDELGGPTPPASPSAKLRALQNQGEATPSPVLLLVKRRRRVQEMPDQARVATPTAAVDPGHPRCASPDAGPGQAACPGASLCAAPLPAAPRLRRWWPVLLALALASVVAAALTGLAVRRSTHARERLRAARQLAAEDEPVALRAALHHLRRAADLAGRKPEVLALAAAIRGRLAIEFGESDLHGAEILLDEAARLDAERQPAAGEDLAVARAYLRLARSPLPDAVTYLFKSLQQWPDSARLLLLYGDALARNGEHYLAGLVLDKLPGSNPQALRARAQLLFRQGRFTDAEVMIRTAVNYGLSPVEADLSLAYFKATADPTETRPLEALLGLSHEPRLTPRQRAWAYLLAAVMQQRLGRRDAARATLSRALVARPIGDAEFLLLSGRLLLELHDLEAARHDAIEGMRLAPRDRRLADLLARIELEMNRPHTALRRLSSSETAASGV